MDVGLQDNKRILSIDVFRGLIIVLMILVNSQGNGSYPMLIHAYWHGATWADLVFPAFLFIVGLTTAVSLKHQINVLNKKQLYLKIIQRSVLLFVLGIFLNAFPYHFDLSVRVYGILQRIAVCYLVCSYIYVNTQVKTQILIFLTLLWVYWFFMTQIPVPGQGNNQLTIEGSWVAYFDQILFSPRHLLAKVYDPEGFFSTIPSIASTLCGVLTGQLLLSSLSKIRQFYLISITGILFLILGWSWNDTFPINKNLWTSSYVLWSSGYSLIIFALCFALIDLLGYKKWSFPFKVFGMNALFAFVFHALLLKIQFMFFFQLSNGTKDNLRAYLADYLFGAYGMANANLMYSMVFLILNFNVVLFLYHRKVFLRI